MIVKMKKLTLLCTRAMQEQTLEALRELGVVHLQPVQPPEGAGLEEARNLLEHLQRALEVLPKKTDAQPSGKAPEETVQAVWALIHRGQALAEQVELLGLEIQRCEPFGSFSPATVRELAARGICVKLCKASAKDTPPPPSGVQFVELHRDRNTVYFALIGRAGFSVEAEEVVLPERSLDDMRQALAALQEERGRIEAELHGYAGDRAAIAALATDAEERIAYLEARAGMGAQGAVGYLRGFLPAAQEPALRAEVAKNGWAVRIEEPSDEDEVPTLLRNPAWIEPIKAVFDMIGVTLGYREIDISAAFLVFFSIFFAMLVGDAGYGVLFLVLTLAAKAKFRQAPQQVFNLLLITSSCTILWGVLTGTYFGASEIPAALKSLRLGWLTGAAADSHLMLLCFVIGAIHLTVAHAWNALRICNTWQVLAQLGWIGSTWTMFFAARTMVLGMPFPPVMITVLWASIALILLFMNPVRKIRTEWFNYVILPLNIVGNFVDLVSYLRLFAVGAAGFAVANAFNQMAVEAGSGRVLGGLITAVILFVAHALNIVLSAMGVMVHGVRLNTLEFSGHIGVQWAGRRYAPFCKVSKSERERN